VTAGESGPGTGRSDESLVSAYVDGEAGAFDELVARYERRVYAICYRYFGNAADAEDAAQEAFVALMRRAGTFAGASSFSTWMYRVTTNACNDLARKRARRPQRSDVDVILRDDLVGTVGSVEDELAARGLPDELVAALRGLDEDTREAVVLHDVYHVPYHELAERSGVAVGTVKSRIHRGHARLAEALQRARTAGGEPSDHQRPPTKRP
jgi:RNA polymerase sigma-70 factor, ECF subfamily